MKKYCIECRLGDNNFRSFVLGTPCVRHRNQPHLLIYLLCSFIIPFLFISKIYSTFIRTILLGKKLLKTFTLTFSSLKLLLAMPRQHQNENSSNFKI